MIDFRTLGIPEHARWIAEAVNDYDPELSLERLPDNHPYMIGQPDKPFAIIHRPTTAPEYVVESFPESMLDERLLAIVAQNDMNRSGRSLEKHDALRWAANVKQERDIADRKATAADKFEFRMRKRTGRGKLVIG
jgi:hypothetical protein